MKPTLATLPIIAVLAGCLGSTTPVPPDNYYRFRAATAEQRLQTQLLPGVLAVAQIDGDGLVRARPVLFASREMPNSVRQHNYHYWADSPTILLRDELVSYLKRRGIAASVVTPKMRVRADYELIGKIKRLERLIGATPSRIAIEVDLAVVRQDRRRLVVENSYAADVPCDDDTVEASVAAFNAALGQIFDSFANDLDRASRDQSPG